MQRIEEVSGAWLRGRKATKSRGSVRRSVRVKVSKAVVKRVLATFSRTRAWQINHIRRTQAAGRRCADKDCLIWSYVKWHTATTEASDGWMTPRLRSAVLSNRHSGLTHACDIRVSPKWAGSV